MSWVPCTHKTFIDHTSDGYRYPNGKLAWKCSECGLVGPWSDSWSYWGSLECPKCQTADIDWVACSSKCAKALKAKMVPGKGRKRP